MWGWTSQAKRVWHCMAQKQCQSLDSQFRCCSFQSLPGNKSTMCINDGFGHKDVLCSFLLAICCCVHNGAKCASNLGPFAIEGTAGKCAPPVNPKMDLPTKLAQFTFSASCFHWVSWNFWSRLHFSFSACDTFHCQHCHCCHFCRHFDHCCCHLLKVHLDSIPINESTEHCRSQNGWSRNIHFP